MKHIVKCRICGLSFDAAATPTSEWCKPVNNRYYHTSCYNNFVQNQTKIREKDMEVEVEESWWLQFVWDYFTKEMKVALNYTKFKSQWDNFLYGKKYESIKMTPKGIYFTLRYFYEIQGGDPSKNQEGIGIVPFIYREATNYWGERNQRDKGICQRIVEQAIRLRQRPVITIQQKKDESIKKRGAIDLNTITAEEEDE